MIRIGIIGLSRGFMLTLPALRADPRIRIAGAVDLREEARRHFAEEFQCNAYDKLGALLADPEIDAVYIATPHQFHAAQTIASLKAGKHVLVEKPMATSVKDCVAMEEAARQSGKILIVGPSHGFDAPVQLGAKMVASGQYGKVKLVTALNFTDFMYRPRRPEELDTSRGGGVVYSQAAHQIDVVRRIVGQPVASIRAVASNWDEARPSDGAYTALMQFEGGASASLTYSGYAHYDSDELVGWVSELGFNKNPDDYGVVRRKFAQLDPTTEGAAKDSRAYPSGSLPSTAPHHEHFGFIIVSCEKADLRVTPSGVAVYGNEAKSFESVPPPISPRAEVLDEFVTAINGEHKPVHDGRWGMETMAVCEALLESSRLGRDVAPL